MLAYTSIPFAQLKYIGTPLSALIMFGHISLTDSTLPTVLNLPDNAEINGSATCSLIQFGSITEYVAPAPFYTLKLNVDDNVAYLVNGESYVAPLDFREGEQVTIEAVPAEGYKFKAWSSLSDTNPFTLTLTQNVELTAIVEPDTEE